MDIVVVQEGKVVCSGPVCKIPIALVSATIGVGFVVTVDDRRILVVLCAKVLYENNNLSSTLCLLFFNYIRPPPHVLCDACKIGLCRTRISTSTNCIVIRVTTRETLL